MRMETAQFTATYVINLARSADRWEALQPALRVMGCPNIIRFEAIDGFRMGAADIQRLQESGVMATDLSAFDAACFAGEIGCALSHAAVLGDIVRRRCASALILEDDVVLAGSSRSWPRRFQAAFSDLPPTWELWYLYRCFDTRHRTKRV